MNAGRRMFIPLVVLCMCAVPLTLRMASGETTGEALFKEHCSPCHPNGDNVVNTKKTLHRKDLELNNIKTAQDIVNQIRDPKPAPTHPQQWAGMKRFDRKTIPDDDAMKIADYILKTFQ